MINNILKSVLNGASRGLGSCDSIVNKNQCRCRQQSNFGPLPKRGRCSYEVWRKRVRSCQSVATLFLEMVIGCRRTQNWTTQQLHLTKLISSPFPGACSPQVIKSRHFLPFNQNQYHKYRHILDLVHDLKHCPHWPNRPRCVKATDWNLTVCAIVSPNPT